MKTNILLVTLILLNFTLTGCIGVNTDFKKLRSHVIEAAGGDYEREFEFSVGSAGIFLAKAFVRFAEEGDNIAELLGTIYRIDIGVYENRSMDFTHFDVPLLQSITNHMEDKGWQYIVRTVDHDELAAVFIDEIENDKLKELFVIALNEDELVMVNIHGDLEELAEVAIREHGLNIHRAKNN